MAKIALLECFREFSDMSLAGYLFGNVDEQGRLDADLDDVNTFFRLQIRILSSRI